MREIESRVVRLEAKRPAFPWHLPLALWTDAQIAAVMRDPVALTDAQLAHIAVGETEDAR
jgi:hypothetical protein